MSQSGHSGRKGPGVGAGAPDRTEDTGRLQGRQQPFLEPSCPTQSPPAARAETDQGVDPDVSTSVSLKPQQQLSLPVPLVNLPEKENLFSVGSALFPGDCFFLHLCTKQLLVRSS